MKKYFNITKKSFEDFGVVNYKELWEKVKKDHDGLRVTLDTIFTKAEGKDNKFHAIFSTESLDRHGDIVRQEWNLKHFKKNPVFLDSHRYDSIEHIIGKVVNIKVKEGQLEGDIEFMLDNPKGLLAFKQAEGGFLGATSVGFIPEDFDDKGIITKSQLLEVSAVSVPANAEALFEKDYEEDIENGAADEEQEETFEDSDEELELKKKTKKKSLIVKVAEELLKEHKTLKLVAEELDNIESARKRRIWSAVRKIISKDKIPVARQ